MALLLIFAVALRLLCQHNLVVSVETCIEHKSLCCIILRFFCAETQDYSQCPFDNITFLNNMGNLTMNIGLTQDANDRNFVVNLSMCNEPTSNILRSYGVSVNQSELLATTRFPEDFYGENINVTTKDSDCPAGMVYIPMFNRTGLFTVVL